MTNLERNKVYKEALKHLIKSPDLSKQGLCCIISKIVYGNWTDYPLITEEEFPELHLFKNRNELFWLRVASVPYSNISDEEVHKLNLEMRKTVLEFCIEMTKN